MRGVTKSLVDIQHDPIEKTATLSVGSGQNVLSIRGRRSSNPYTNRESLMGMKTRQDDGVTIYHNPN